MVFFPLLKCRQWYLCPFRRYLIRYLLCSIFLCCYDMVVSPAYRLPVYNFGCFSGYPHKSPSTPSLTLFAGHMACILTLSSGTLAMSICVVFLRISVSESLLEIHIQHRLSHSFLGDQKHLHCLFCQCSWLGPVKETTADLIATPRALALEWRPITSD